MMCVLSKGKRLALKESIQALFLCFIIKRNIQSTHMQNNVYTMWINAIWRAQAAGRKECPSKRYRYTGTHTCTKGESNTVFRLSLYQTQGLLIINISNAHLEITVSTNTSVVVYAGFSYALDAIGINLVMVLNCRIGDFPRLLFLYHR